MSKLHFLKKGCLLCLQLIALLLKDMTKVKSLLLIIRLNANMSWIAVLCTEIPRSGQVGGRVVVAPYFLSLYRVPHLETAAPTISHIEQARALHTSTTDLYGYTSTLHCLILAAVAWPSQHFLGSPHKRLCRACVELPYNSVKCCCSVRAVFTSKRGLGLPKLQTSICKLKYRNLYSRYHPYCGPISYHCLQCWCKAWLTIMYNVFIVRAELRIQKVDHCTYIFTLTIQLLLIF